MSQGAAAGAVVSTADDMHVFIEALLAGELFSDEGTLAEMQVTVVTGSGTAPKYGIGLAEKAEGVWGHGGQTLGFESDVAFFEEQGLSMVGWGTSANNIMAGGVNAVGGVGIDRIGVDHRARIVAGQEPDTIERVAAEGVGERRRTFGTDGSVDEYCRCGGRDGADVGVVTKPRLLRGIQGGKDE